MVTFVMSYLHLHIWKNVIWAFVPTGTIRTKPGHFCVLNAAPGTPGQTASNRDWPGKTGTVGHLVLFVTDLPTWITNNMLMFGDDMKIWWAVHRHEHSENIQRDLDKLMDWTDKWLLRLNPDKCTVMHVNHSLDANHRTHRLVGAIQTIHYMDGRLLDCWCYPRDGSWLVNVNPNPKSWP